MKPQTPTFLVVDDHPTIRDIHRYCLAELDDQAQCIDCATPEEALEWLQLQLPDLAVVDLMYVVQGIQTAKPGLALLAEIFDRYPQLNLLVCTSDPLLLRPLTEKILTHQGGFMVVDKTQTSDQFLQGAHYALEGLGGLPRSLRSGLSYSEQQLTLLKLMCEDCLTTQAIATQMHSSVRAIEYHIKALKDDLLGDDDTQQHNTRVAICKAARQQRLLPA